MALPYATEYQLSILEKAIDKKIKEAVINGVDTNPTKLSELQNDVGYITNSALSAYARKVEIPTRVSQLQNDSKYITNAALNGYAKASDLSTLATKVEVNAVVANIPSIDGLATEVQLNEVRNSIPTDYVTTATAANYALKSEIPDVSGFATEAQVNAVAANIPTDYIPNSQLNTLATKEEVENKQDKIVEISGTFGTDGTGEKKVTGEFTEAEGGQALALNFYNLGAPTFINFNIMSYTKKVYTAEELYAWFGATDVISLRGAVSRNNMFVLAFGVTSQSLGYMQYRIPVQYVEVDTATLPKIIIKAYGPDYSNDKLCQYVITANTDGTTFGDTNCNIQVEKIAIQS